MVDCIIFCYVKWIQDRTWNDVLVYCFFLCTHIIHKYTIIPFFEFLNLLDRVDLKKSCYMLFSDCQLAISILQWKWFSPVSFFVLYLIQTWFFSKQMSPTCLGQIQVYHQTHIQNVELVICRNDVLVGEVIRMNQCLLYYINEDTEDVKFIMMLANITNVPNISLNCTYSVMFKIHGFSSIFQTILTAQHVSACKTCH